ncbi:MAG: MscL family protein [Clostridia bacterium]|nr:MscL family protein [Clostridia bacterium]
MKNLFAEFKKFILRGNVVDMAVGVTVAGAFTAIVTAFTKGFVSPIVALITGGSPLTEMKTIVREAETVIEDGVEVVVKAEVAILWGAFIQAMLDFLIIALVLFSVMKIWSVIQKRAAKIANEISAKLNAEKLEKERLEAEAKAAAEAEAKAEADRIAAEKAQAEKELADREVNLLIEIRDLLKQRD